MEKLFLNDNWIKGEETIALMDDIVKGCPKLTILNLSDNNIGDSATKRIFEIIGLHSTGLTELYYNYNEILQGDVRKFCMDTVLNKLHKIKVFQKQFILFRS